MQVRFALFAPVLAIALTGCSHKPAQPVMMAPILRGDSAHPGVTKGWVDTKLYFGLGPVDHPERGVSEADWRGFLDREVTPRFPQGLSVMDVYGSGRGRIRPRRKDSARRC